MDWFVQTLRSYPEIAIFLALAAGYYVGGKSWKGLSLGAVTATLIAAVLIGQLGITISPNVKSFAFLLFLFAVGYGVGPQFVRGIAKDGLPQALFAAVACVFSLGAVWSAAHLAGYDLGFGSGLLAGSQTISASMGLAANAINRLALSADQTKALLNEMPIAYAVTYIFGTVGSALILAMLGPKLLRIDLQAECQRYEREHGGQHELDGPKSAWHKYELRAFRVGEASPVIGKTAAQAEALAGEARVFIDRLRREGVVQDAKADTVINAGDIIAVAGQRDVLIDLVGHAAEEVDDPELLAVPADGVDIYVTSRQADGKTLAQLSTLPAARGVFLRKITRGATSTNIPILPSTVIHRGDILTLVGRTTDTAAAAKALGYADRATDVSDVAFIGAAIAIGALLGATALKIGSVPLSFSTAGGALISGIIFGWLRSVHPTFGRISAPALWFMNSVGLNVFIAVVGITAGPSFVAGLKEAGLSLFLWGVFVTTLPFVVGIFTGKYLFKMHPGIVLGCCAGARTTTAALGAIQDEAKSKVPALGYTITYAVGNVLLITWGVIIVLLMK